MTARAAIAIGAAVALAALDLFLLTVAFIGTPGRFWIAAMATAGLLGVALKLRLHRLAFVAQNIVSIVLLYRFGQYTLLPIETRGSGHLTHLLVPLAAIIIGNLFVWLIMRGTSARVPATS